MLKPKDDQVRLARAYVTKVAAGGLDPSHYAPDMTVWTITTGLITREAFLPRLAAAKEIWREPLAMTIDSVTAQPGRVVIQARSKGVLHTGAEYGNDYIFLLEFDDAGRIRHVREYFDPVRLETIFRPALNAWREAQAGAQAT